MKTVFFQLIPESLIRKREKTFPSFFTRENSFVTRTLRRQIKEECCKDYRILPLSFSFIFRKTLQYEKTKHKLSLFEVFSQSFVSGNIGFSRFCYFRLTSFKLHMLEY